MLRMPKWFAISDHGEETRRVGSPMAKIKYPGTVTLRTEADVRGIRWSHTPPAILAKDLQTHL
jgi:hypothetical protein